MLKGGSTSRTGTVRSNPPARAPSSSAHNAHGKKRPEATAAAAAAAASKSKEASQQTSAQAPHDISDTGSEETDISTSEGDDSSWISWFCGLRGNELLCEVDEDYIQDDFNLCGLQGQVPFYDYALDMILDNDSLSGEIDGEEHNEIESAAEMLYGLIHARYIVTSKGLNAMHEKYKRADFGRCPRVFCGGQQCLPVGTSDIPRNCSMKIYCPKCEDLYLPRCKYQSNMDGSYVGTTFPHLYLMIYPSAKPAKPVQNYVPRVFGFKLHKGSR
ncbi:putative casein kinase II subunit beta-4 isoform X1 [Iris pallida]|uniref:Casein kinase II subunit beta n=1 Tax=Iris pallida TaxID=29817 RepID=A0AAX6HNS5_IRIPA|nr:putative casein kinase II subunit beta-4 isoform X1 [Iris pallida]